MQIGIVQTNPVFGDKKANQKEIEQLTAGKFPHLWIMPELALTGYELRGRAQAMEMAEEVPNGESTQWLHSFCRDRNCFAVMGIAEREGNSVYNGAILVGPDGFVGRYRKLHLYDREYERFDPGNLPFQVWDTGQVRLGMMICYDWRFPEAARTIALQRAQLIAHPSNLVLPYCQAAMITRALENRVFTATANRIGTETNDGRPISFTGKSIIVSELGATLALGPEDKTACIIVDIDPTRADNKVVNEFNSLFSERRPEFYSLDDNDKKV